VTHQCLVLGWRQDNGNRSNQESKFDFPATRQLGWCREREKIDWQETHKFDCRLVRKIFIFCCPSQISTSRWRVARKSNFDSELDQFPLSWRHPNPQGSSHTTDNGSFQESLAGCKEFSLRFRLLLQWLVENCSDITKSTLPLERKTQEHHLGLQ